MAYMVAIGIDFGTSKTCAAVYKDGAIEVVPNEYGNKSTPSCVTFTDTQYLIGESALVKALSLYNTVYSVKRLMGRKFNELDGKGHERCLFYQVVDSNGKLAISVEYKGARRTFEPEEIASAIIGKMKDISQSYLGVAVDHAVITVPVHFNESQRQAVAKAAGIAGLRVIDIMTETTAGIFAFGLHRNVSHELNILTFHLGGCTCHVTITTITKNREYDIKATTCSIVQGVNEFTMNLMDFFIGDFVYRYGTDIIMNELMFIRIRQAAEKAIIDISLCTEATIYVDALCDWKNYFRKMTRSLFEAICADCFKRIKFDVQQVLKAARMQPSDIYQVLLIGGGTKLYKIQDMMIEQFNGRVLSTANPDHTVAYGAAIQAALLSHDSIENIKDLFLVNLIPLSLGVEICKGIMLVVVERNTSMPCTKSNIMTTFEDNQTELSIKIYEGERSLTKSNNFLGTLILTGITPAPRGVAKINVVFNVSASGVLLVHARDQTSGSSQDMIIPKTKRLNSLEIRRNITESQLFSNSDKEKKCRLEARDSLEVFVYSTRQIVADNIDKLTKKEKELMYVELEDAFNWLKENYNSDIEDYELKYTELSFKWSLLIKKLTYHLYSTSGTSDKRQYYN